MTKPDRVKQIAGLPDQEMHPPSGGAPTPAFYRKVVESAADLISVISPDGHFLYLSPSQEKMFGFADGEIKRLDESRFHPDDFAMAIKEFNDLVRNGGTRQLTNHRLRHANGTWRWIQTRATNMIDDPDVGGILMVSRDVTEQTRREDEIRLAEISARFGHWRWERGKATPEWSNGLFELLGYKRSRHRLSTDWIAKIIHPDDFDDLVNAIVHALETGRPMTIVTSMLHADGTYRRIMSRARVEQAADDEQTSLIGICQDITELEEATVALRRSEEEFRVLAENSMDSIARYSLDGRAEYISPATEMMIGYKPDELIGMYPIDLIHPVDADEIAERIMQMYEDLGTFRIPFRMRRKDGPYVWLEASMSPLCDPETGEPTGFVASSRDISERKRYEEELMNARERAEAANLTKSRFLANMSHELRTPLNAILGFSELMMEETFGPLGSERYSEYMTLIHESGQHLLALINDILDMSKIEAGKYDLMLEEVDLTDPIAKAVRMVETRIAEARLTLELDIEPARGIAARADGRAVMQTVLNLLSNAVKFTPEGGTVRIAAAPAGDMLEITVADTGVGIDANDIERVQRPFEQVVRHAELASQGTGLGLPLVRALVEIQKGSFSLESEKGKGTTARVVLPLAGTGTASMRPAVA